MTLKQNQLSQLNETMYKVIEDKKDKRLIIDYDNIFSWVFNSKDYKNKMEQIDGILNSVNLDYYFEKIYRDLPEDSIEYNWKKFHQQYKYADIKDMFKYYDDGDGESNELKLIETVEKEQPLNITKDKVYSELVFNIIYITGWDIENIKAKGKAIISATKRNVIAKIIAKVILNKCNIIKNTVWDFNNTSIVVNNFIKDEKQWFIYKTQIKSLDYLVNKYNKNKIINNVNIYKVKNNTDKFKVIWILSYNNTYKYNYIFSNNKKMYIFLRENNTKKAVRIIQTDEKDSSKVNIINTKVALKEEIEDKINKNDKNNKNNKLDVLNSDNIRLYYILFKYFNLGKAKNDITMFENFVYQLFDNHKKNFINYASIVKNKDNILNKSISVWYNCPTPQHSSIIRYITINVDKNKKDELKEILNNLPTSKLINKFSLETIKINNNDIEKELKVSKANIKKENQINKSNKADINNKMKQINF